MAMISPTTRSIQKGRFLPREGFTADVVQGLIQKTILNPALTLPLWLLAHYTDQGLGLALDHPTAVRRLKVALYLGAARWVNGILNQGALNNWERDTYDWSREIVLITGGSDGFGKLLVHYFAEKNQNTVVINMDVQEPKYTMPSKNCHYLQVDLANPEAIAAVSKDLKEKYGNPSVVILNAGIANPYTIVNMPDAVLQKVFAVNTLAHFRLAREFLPHIAKQNHGMIVTVASLAAFVTPAGLVEYCASKAAAVSFHEGVTTELVHRLKAPKVRTICLTPNFAATKLANKFVNASNFMSPTLMPETVAEALFEKIMSESSGFVTIPKIHAWMGLTARSWPWWIQKGLQNSMKDFMKMFADRKQE